LLWLGLTHFLFHGFSRFGDRFGISRFRRGDNSRRPPLADRGCGWGTGLLGRRRGRSGLFGGRRRGGRFGNRRRWLQLSRRHGPCGRDRSSGRRRGRLDNRCRRLRLSGSRGRWCRAQAQGAVMNIINLRLNGRRRRSSRRGRRARGLRWLRLQLLHFLFQGLARPGDSFRIQWQDGRRRCRWSYGFGGRGWDRCSPCGLGRL